MGSHIMGPSRLNHGLSQCIKCGATDREIAFALGPVCPVPTSTQDEARRMPRMSPAIKLGKD